MLIEENRALRRTFDFFLIATRFENFYSGLVFSNFICNMTFSSFGSDLIDTHKLITIALKILEGIEYWNQTKYILWTDQNTSIHPCFVVPTIYFVQIYSFVFCETCLYESLIILRTLAQEQRADEEKQNFLFLIIQRKQERERGWLLFPTNRVDYMTSIQSYETGSISRN